MMFDQEIDDEINEEYFTEVDEEVVQRNIINNMHHLIFCDLTVGRSDRCLEPYDSNKVNMFIRDNQSNIDLAAAMMYYAYEQDNDLLSLMPENPPMDWFGEYLYICVDTGVSDTNEDDDEEDYNDDNCESDLEEI